MNFYRIITVLGLLSITVLVARGRASEVAAQGDLTAQIEKFEDDFSGALARNDVASLQQLLSEDWKIISGDGGFITKARFLSVLNSGKLKHDAMTFEARNIRIYETVAVVTEHASSSGSYQGAAFHTDEISTDIIVNRNGHWVCVLTQLTTVVHR